MGRGAELVDSVLVGGDDVEVERLGVGECFEERGRLRLVDVFEDGPLEPCEGVEQVGAVVVEDALVHGLAGRPVALAGFSSRGVRRGGLAGWTRRTR